jgi:hypothetical protein
VFGKEREKLEASLLTMDTHLFDESGYKLIMDAFLDKESVGSNARLSCIPKLGSHRSIHSNLFQSLLFFIPHMYTFIF